MSAAHFCTVTSQVTSPNVLVRSSSDTIGGRISRYRGGVAVFVFRRFAFYTDNIDIYLRLMCDRPL